MTSLSKLEDAYFAGTKPSQEELLGFRNLFSKYADSSFTDDQLATLAQNARSQNLDLGAELGQDYYTDKLAKQIANQRKSLGTEKYYKGDLGAMGGIDTATQYMASRLALSGIRDIKEIGERTQNAYGIDTSADPQKAAQDFQTWYQSGGWKGQSANSLVNYNGKQYWYTNYGGGDEGTIPVLLPFGNVGEPVKALYNKRTGEQLKQGQDVGYAYANTQVPVDSTNARYTIGGTFAGNNTGLNVSMVDGIPMFYTSPGPSSSFISKESIGPVLAIASMMVPGLGVAIGSTITGALGVAVSPAVAGAIGTGVLTTIASGGDVKKGAISAATSYFAPQIAGQIGDAANQIFESPAGKKLIENVSAAALRTAALGGDADQIQNSVLGATAGGLFDVVTQNMPGFNDITDPKTRAAVIASVQSALDAPGDLSDKFKAATLSGATTLGLSKIDIDGKKFTDLSPGQQSIVTTALGRELANKPLTSDDIFKTVIDAVSKEVRADIQKERAEPVKKAESQEQLTRPVSGGDESDFSQLFGADATQDQELTPEFLSPKVGDADQSTGVNNMDDEIDPDILRGLIDDMGLLSDQDLEDIQRGFADIGSTYKNQINTVIADITSKVNEYESYGATRDEALSAAIDNMSESLGQTKDEFLNLLGETQSSLNDRITSSEKLFAEQIGGLQNDLLNRIGSFEKAGLSRDEAIQRSVSELSNELGETKESLLQKLGTSTGQLREEMGSLEERLGEQIGGVKSDIAGLEKSYDTKLASAVKDITDQVNEYEAYGATRDEALQAAIDNVSNSLGIAQDELLSQLGETQQSLNSRIVESEKAFATQLSGMQSDLIDRIGAFERAGLSRDDAIKQSLAELAGELGDTEEGLLQKLGTTEQQLQTQIGGVEERLGAQIGALGKEYETKLTTAVGDITDRMNEFEAYGATRDEALQAAIDNVAEQLGISSKDLLDQLNVNQRQLQQQIEASELEYAKQVTGLGEQVTGLGTEVSGVKTGLSELGKSVGEQVSGLGKQVTGIEQVLAKQPELWTNLIAGLQKGFGTQIGGLQSQLTAQQKAQQAQAAQQQAAMMAPKFEAFYANIPGYKPFDIREFSSEFYDQE